MAWNYSTYQISSSNPPLAVGDTVGHPRGIDRFSNGDLLAYVHNSTVFEFWLSQDEGETWTHLTGDLTLGSGAYIQPALFINEDDEVYMFWSAGGSVYSNAATLSGTTLTWNGATTVHGGTVYYYTQDAVMWKNGTNYYCAVLASEGDSQQLRLIYGKRNGDITAGWTSVSYYNVANYADHAGGTIDFHHTGDGKTPVLDGVNNPHLFVGFNTHNGSFFHRKYTNTAELTWTAGTTTQVSSNALVTNSLQDRRMPQIVFDGERSIIAESISVSPYLAVKERDLADTAYTDITPAAFATSSDSMMALTYDPNTKDLVLFATHNSNYDVYANHYNRKLDAWDGWEVARSQSSTYPRVRALHTTPVGKVPMAITSDGSETSLTKFDMSPFAGAAGGWNMLPIGG